MPKKSPVQNILVAAMKELKGGKLIELPGKFATNSYRGALWWMVWKKGSFPRANDFRITQRNGKPYLAKR